MIDKNRKDIKRGIPLTYNKLPSSDRQKQEGYKERGIPLTYNKLPSSDRQKQEGYKEGGYL